MRWLLTALLALLTLQTPVSAQGPVSTGRTTGPLIARVTLEIFSDFQCPYCKALAEETLPRIKAEYAQTGKIRLVHRDFPLSGHGHARTAALLAAAAHMTGQFDIVAEAVFRQQSAWAETGRLEDVVRSVLPADQAESVIRMAGSAQAAALVDADIERGRSLNVSTTPTLLFTRDGRTYRSTGAASYAILSRFLDSLVEP